MNQSQNSYTLDQNTFVQQNQDENSNSLSPVKVVGDTVHMSIGTMKIIYWVSFAISLLLYTMIFVGLNSAIKAPIYAFLLVLILALGITSFLSKLMPIGKEDTTITMVVYGVFALAILVATGIKMGSSKGKSSHGVAGQMGNRGVSPPMSAAPRQQQSQQSRQNW